jgi:hypothetical protein
MMCHHLREFSSEADRKVCAAQLAMFDNYLIRFLLGEEVFFSPLGSIDSTHVVRIAL